MLPGEGPRGKGRGRGKFRPTATKERPLFRAREDHCGQAFRRPAEAIPAIPFAARSARPGRFDARPPVGGQKAAEDAGVMGKIVH